MRYAYRLCVVCVLLSACAGTPHRPERASAVETRLYSRETIDSRSEFKDAIVGQQLRGEGVDVTVGPNGMLVGTYYGQPFLGGWDYRDGEFCVSLSKVEVRRADDRKCFHAAISGRSVLLVPADEG